MSNKDNVSTGNAGEYFVAGELERSVYCIMKLPKIADQNGESCISKLEKNAEAFG